MNRLKELRQKNNLTLKELSEQLSKRNIKISADALAKYERGDREPKIDKWNHLAEFYGVSPDYLMGLNNNSFGNRIKELRIKNGFSQSDLAKATGLTRQAISNYENNERTPNDKTWQKLADCFNVSIPFARGEINVELIAKIAKMVFLIETTPFVTDCGFTNNAYESSKMVCSLMMLLLKQLNLNCSEEFKNIILNSQKIFNDPRFENICCSAKATGPVSYQKAKQCIEHVSYVSDRNNFENTIKDAKKLIGFYDKL
ncbi:MULTISPECIES: helix-turn-helix domain-containing protein [unclassified Lactobacillus]|uniref:helix-turn-helix domain-containing protein n=1 Tax=unclassified Lactobacillus TaxID=2620435 RepID=UPI00226A333B|nr:MULTISPECIES: helix-turn-helix transcriptional regulator [unclassified Lactobacillus]MCX8721420.1 transcriptional regulator [Lactobacillus sp. B4010]MCX8732410.1 transcriptional regulator [Lactobacillus sp. B4015]MCX8734630.1 transcriptional regulator [Lactobacillus sp. B4012]